MYKQYKTVLAGIIFLCAPTAALAEFTLTDAAIVLVPAALGACGGYGAVKHSINSEKSELELKQQKLLRVGVDLKSSRDITLTQISMLTSINEHTNSRNSSEIEFLNSVVCDGDKKINELNQAMEQVKILMHKNRLNKKLLESNAHNIRVIYSIDALNFQFNEYVRALKGGEVQVRDIKSTQEAFERAKTPERMTSADRELFGAYINIFDRNLQAINNDLQFVQEEIEEAAEDLKEVTSDESRRLRNGALLGGAVGGVAGLAVLGGVKYAPDARGKRQQEPAIKTIWRIGGYEQAYKKLGLSMYATQEDITAAFRASMLVNHPDKNGGSEQATERSKELEAARELAFNFAQLLSSRATAEMLIRSRPAALLPEGQNSADALD